MYDIGTLVTYGRTGVCRVEQVIRREGQDYYALKPLYQSCDIFAPVDSDKVFIRPIISREEVHRLIDALPEMKAEPYEGVALWDLSQHYQQAMASHDCGDLFALTKSLYAKRQETARRKRKFGAVDERFMKLGEELLFGELAAVLDIRPQEVPDYISRRLAGAES